MQSSTMKKAEISKKLSLIPEQKLDEVGDFIEFILSKSQAQERKPVKLRGIWKNKGFEKIKSLESELKEIRISSANSILNRDV